MGKFSLISSLKSVMSESINTEDMYCSSYTDPDERKLCSSIEKTLSTDAKKKQNKFKNRVINKLKRVYTIFEKQNDKSDIVYSNIKQYEYLFKEKISYLERFIETLSPDCDNLKQQAIKDLEVFKEKGKNILMYKKKVEDSERMAYSFINRLNTNYSALAILLTDLSKEFNYPQGDPELTIENFLTDDNVIPYLLNVLNKPNLTIQRILNTISDTRKKGNRTEEEYKQYLESKGIPYEDFADDFGLVDFLGVDLMVKYPGQNYYSPIQIKSRPMGFEQVMIHNYDKPGCKCFLIYPEDNGWAKVGSESISTKTTEYIEGPEQVVECKSIKKAHANIFCNTPKPRSVDKTIQYTIFKDESGNEFKTETKNVKTVSFGSLFFPESSVIG